jgi:hypothetical protein
MCHMYFLPYIQYSLHLNTMCDQVQQLKTHTKSSQYTKGSLGVKAAS